MKKIVLSLALVAMMSVSFVSCKDAAATEPAVTEEAPAMEESVEAAAVAVDTAAAAAVEAVEAGAVEGAEKAAAEVKEEVKK
ncbi:hypothetical protein [Flavobacterium sp.]|uniref:hypothetical protein n=1 Tax=Flavobacterium sp. TaxID=239 RepID=UPI00286D03A5|nr:hypothetical protein [Flavobacterium sp.]